MLVYWRGKIDHAQMDVNLVVIQVSPPQKHCMFLFFHQSEATHSTGMNYDEFQVANHKMGHPL